jgi:hypothetical protein
MSFSRFGSLAAITLAVVATALAAQSPTPLNNVEVASHQAYGPAQTHSIVSDPDVPGGKALRMVMPDASANPWNAGVNSIIKAPLVKGDKIEATVMLRLAPGSSGTKGTVKVLFQLTGAPYTEFATSQARVTASWTPFRLKAKAPLDLAANTARIALQLGYGQQTIDVGPILISKIP